MADTRNPETSSHFDANAVAAAQEAPTLTVGRFLYRGRLLSIEEWLPWWERLLELQRAKPGDGRPVGEELRKLHAFYRDYLRLVFPRSHYRWWAPDPVKHLLAQPFTVVEEAITCFFFLQARATFGAKAMESALKTPPSPPGTPSPPATASGLGAT